MSPGSYHIVCLPCILGNLTVPTAPQNLQTTVGNGLITLMWQAPINNGGSVITNYKIYRGTSAGAESYLLTIGNVLTYTNTNLTNGQSYYYKVSAVNGVGEGPLSSEVSATPATKPSIPQNLQTVIGNHTINLTWQAPSSNGGFSIINYRIYKGTFSGNESLLTTIGNVLTYSDTNLTNGRRYYYRISALNEIGEGNLSIEVHATPATKPHVPQNLLILVKNGKLILSWQPSDNGGDSISNYKIYRGTSSGNETYFVTISNLTRFTDTNLVNGQPYYYRISAVNALGEGPWSAEVVAMVYVSQNENQTFYLIIILLFGAVALGLSGYSLYLNRKVKSLELKLTKKSRRPLGKKALKPWEESTLDSVIMEKQLRKLSKSDAKYLFDSLMLRFNRLYKTGKWEAALVLLEQLSDLAEFLGDQKKVNDLALKYEEIQGKFQK